VRDQVWIAADDALRTSGLARRDWAADWLADIRRGGGVSRLSPDRAARVLTQAVTALAQLLNPASTASRGELAERVTGTAHGLDDDTILSRLVLRGIARARGAEPPRDARARRELWEAAGVATDQVSSTVLTFGLLPLGEDGAARLLRDRSLAGFETHLTLRDLRRLEWRLPPDTEVFVCENPRVLEAAMDAACPRPLVCTSGNPTTAVLALLDALTGAGARLAYRGDFDWPGIAMANRVIRRWGARPWRLSAADYEQHVQIARASPAPRRAGGRRRMGRGTGPGHGKPRRRRPGGVSPGTLADGPERPRPDRPLTAEHTALTFGETYPQLIMSP
jgi:uncharacterized protein (TIGR02679 family)